MRVTTIHGPRDIRLEDRPQPTVDAPTDAVLRVTAGCICGSDLWPYRGENEIDPGATIGHEMVGVIEEVGAEVTSFRPGDFVIAPFCHSDNTCAHCRAGMTSACVNGGFTTGKPWLAVNPNYAQINAAAQQHDPDSVYNYHRRLIALRSQTPALIYGEFKDIDPANAQVFAYTRTLSDQRYLVVINFSEQPLKYALPAGIKINALTLDSGAGRAVAQGAAQLELQPWQASIYQL